MRFTCDDGGSSKFWEGHVRGAALELRWGETGSKEQSKTRKFRDEGRAWVELAKLVGKKLKEGYVEER
jgi:predicted DNA-binding WGR domain protein